MTHINKKALYDKCIANSFLEGYTVLTEGCVSTKAISAKVTSVDNEIDIDDWSAAGQVTSLHQELYSQQSQAMDQNTEIVEVSFIQLMAMLQEL